MVRIADCIACETGDHKNHRRVVQAAPEGVLGGVMCQCKGECVENVDERREKYLSRMGLTPAVRAAIGRLSS